MADKKLVMRVGALASMGGAVALFAAQAGVLPGLERGPANAPEMSAPPIALSTVPAPPSARTPAAIAAVLDRPAPADAVVEDALAPAQSHDLPDNSGFSAAPHLDAVAPALATGTERVRPAAFELATVLPTPRPTAPKPEQEAAEDLSPFGLPCGLDVTAEAGDAAMIALGVAAPCHPEAVVTIIHSGMTIAGRADAFGLMTLDIPALETPAFVTVALPDGTETDVFVDVPDLTSYDRVALAWEGALGVELHVMENGAVWMSEGHVHPDAPRTPDAAASGGGFLTLLGDPGLGTPKLAQVYTMPRGNGPETATLAVDAPVTLANCAQAAEIRVLHVTGETSADLVPLGFTYPTCDAVGDTLVLQNVFGDLRLAAN